MERYRDIRERKRYCEQKGTYSKTERGRLSGPETYRDRNRDDAQ